MFCTLPSVMHIELAIWLLAMPRANNVSASCSRGVSLFHEGAMAHLSEIQ